MKLAELQGRRLAYWDQGSGVPIFFIHGVGTTGEVWFGDLEPLSSEHRLIAYDRRGYGASSTSPRDWVAHRRDAEDLLDTLGIEKAIVVGYSAGAGIALDLVLARPQLATSLVLLDPAVNVKKCVTPGFIKVVLAAKILRRLRGERRGAEHWMRYVASYSTGGTAFDRAPPERREKLLANAAGVFADAASTGGDHVDESRLASVAMPVTLVEAMLSPPFLRRSCTRLHRLMPQARVITMPNAGHYLAIDAKRELLDILRDAVREGAPRSA